MRVRRPPPSSPRARQHASRACRRPATQRGVWGTLLASQLHNRVVPGKHVHTSWGKEVPCPGLSARLVIIVLLLPLPLPPTLASWRGQVHLDMLHFLGLPAPYEPPPPVTR